MYKHHTHAHTERHPTLPKKNEGGLIRHIYQLKPSLHLPGQGTSLGGDSTEATYTTKKKTCIMKKDDNFSNGGMSSLKEDTWPSYQTDGHHGHLYKTATAKRQLFV